MSKLQLNMSNMLNHFDPDFGLIIDLFAGGGGASEGIRAALGRDPDVAVNHDPEAISMHTMNHHDTMHFTADVFEVDPKTIFPEYPVGLLWASPACTHFSKARGSKPVCKQLRSLAWIVVKWARLRKPAQIYLENVEEFLSWGPVLDDGQPCPIRKGETFKRFVADLEKLGYDVEWREVKAHEYGAPTIRKRLFMVARCDGKEIVWPEPTNGDPKSPEVKSGKRTPFRTAAEIIDWSIPGNSIFMRTEEIKAKKLRIKRPLKDTSLRRIGKGLSKFVFKNADPFIVTVNHSSVNDNFRGQSINDPLQTVTRKHGFGVVKPKLAPFVSTYFGERNGESDGRGATLDKPLSTITSGGMRHSLISPVLIGIDNGSSKSASWSPETPLTTIVTENRHALVENHMVKLPHIVRDFKSSIGSNMNDPIGTITTQGNGKAALCVSHAVKFRGTNYGYPMSDPVHTITAAGTHQGLVTSYLNSFYGNAEDIGSSMDDPLRTVTTKDRFAKVDIVLDPVTGALWDSETMERIIAVREFIQTYCGDDLGEDERIGIVTIKGLRYQIVDISLRMLKPRELYNAQGFRPDYIIDRTIDHKPITGTAQVRMVGNSVCPPAAEAIIRANQNAPFKTVPIFEEAA